LAGLRRTTRHKEPVEFSVALDIGSMSLFADSIDFLEDTSINFLIFLR
jgi:hypothetical protein